jgi:hypothetical protein
MHALTNALLRNVNGPKVSTLITIITVHVHDSVFLTQQILVLSQTSVIY